MGATGFMGVGNLGGASIGPGLFWMSFDPLRTGSSRRIGVIGSTGSTRFGGLAGLTGGAGMADFTGVAGSTGSSGSFSMWLEPLCASSSGTTGMAGIKGSTRLGGLIGSADFTVDDDSAGSSAIRGRIRIRLTGNIGLAGAAC